MIAVQRDRAGARGHGPGPIPGRRGRPGARQRRAPGRGAGAIASAELDGLPIEYVLGGHPFEPTLDADVAVRQPGRPARIAAAGRGARGAASRSPAAPASSSSAARPRSSASPDRAARPPPPRWSGGSSSRPDARRSWAATSACRCSARLAEIDPDRWVILELSSFQLEPLDVSPHIAAITNITPNHLDRHPSMEAYTAAKAQIVNHQRHD